MKGDYYGTSCKERKHGKKMEMCLLWPHIKQFGQTRYDLWWKVSRCT